MTIAEYILETLSKYNQTERDIHWIWYASENKPIWLDDGLLTKEIQTRETFAPIDLYIFTKDYIFIVCKYNGLQPVPNSMVVASRMTKYTCYRK